VQSSGTITGLVLRPDGVTPAVGASVTIQLNIGSITVQAQNDGTFTATGVPLGAFTVNISDPSTTGIAAILGRSTTTNGQTANLGTITLDGNALSVVSSNPADGATGVSVNQDLTVTFSESLSGTNGIFAPRKPRTDAQRNRERILEVAKEVFTQSGANASLDDIAKVAGVGAGTLYRHFPTRDALIEAVYRTEVEKLATAERKFAAAMSPIEALRAWMLLFIDYIATKQIIAPALNAYVGGPSKLYEGSRAQIQGAIGALVKRAIKNGDIRRDLEPFDLLRALIGVSNVASGPDWQQSARRLVDILVTGSRPIK
jgi:AcrR family transcriptional regulator